MKLPVLLKLCAAVLLLVMQSTFAQSNSSTPQAETGRVERLESFKSAFVDARHVDVWLPADYEARVAAGERMNVIYMHDGQMLYDPRTTWNKQAWHIDRTITRLMKEGRIGPTMVVGIWNNGQLRYNEYFAQKSLNYLPQEFRTLFVEKAMRNKPLADNYLKFIVQELKPAIDAKYATTRDAKGTVLMGASMGGIISVYGLCEYPQVFGGAAGISTHWVGSGQHNAQLPLAAFVYLRDALPKQTKDKQTHRIYQDHGTKDIDALYAPYQGIVDQLIRDAGYIEATDKTPAQNANFMTRVFEGAGHNEKSWEARLEIPVLFLLGK